MTLNSAQTSVVFAGIPQTYNDLVLVCSGTTTSTGAAMWLQVNGVTSGYGWTRLYGNGNGSTPSSDRASNQGEIPISTGNFTNTTSIVYFNGYSNSSTLKSILTKNGAAASFVNVAVGSTNSTAPITNITVRVQSFALAAGSTFSLYGIDAQVSAQAKATGGQTIIRDSSYWYHVFTSSGTFTPKQAITADVLVIAGGGGGGGGFNVSGAMGGAGGGAGGWRVFTSQSLSPSAYACTVGAGGAAGGFANNGGAISGSRGGTGSNSQFGALSISTGGGGGGNRFYGPSSGGSGGGTASDEGSAAGTGIVGQGNDGGLAYGSGTSRAAAGGGGSGAVGGRPSGQTGGTGGTGISTYSSWGLATNTGQNVGGTWWYAGGGGGGGGTSSGGSGAGGNGGGGAGAAYNATGTSGAAGTGGGGGGGAASDSASGTTGNGGAGGSGIVIVRYAV